MNKRLLRNSAVGLLALLGCGTEPDAFGRCDETLAVTVSHEADPEFSWTPADCHMHELNVTEDNQVRWLISGNDAVNGSHPRCATGRPSRERPIPARRRSIPSSTIRSISGGSMIRGMLQRLVHERFLHQVE
jgi:hypothetical protein